MQIAKKRRWPLYQPTTLMQAAAREVASWIDADPDLATTIRDRCPERVKLAVQYFVSWDHRHQWNRPYSSTWWLLPALGLRKQGRKESKVLPVPPCMVSGFLWLSFGRSFREALHWKAPDGWAFMSPRDPNVLIHRCGAGIISASVRCPVTSRWVEKVAVQSMYCVSSQVPDMTRVEVFPFEPWPFRTFGPPFTSKAVGEGRKRGGLRADAKYKILADNKKGKYVPERMEVGIKGRRDVFQFLGDHRDPGAYVHAKDIVYETIRWLHWVSSEPKTGTPALWPVYLYVPPFEDDDEVRATETHWQACASVKSGM